MTFKEIYLFVGISYSKYVGFHEWREKTMTCSYNWTYIEKAFKQVPGLAKKFGKE